MFLMITVFCSGRCAGYEWEVFNTNDGISCKAPFYFTVKLSVVDREKLPEVSRRFAREISCMLNDKHVGNKDLNTCMFQEDGHAFIGFYHSGIIETDEAEREEVIFCVSDKIDTKKILLPAIRYSSAENQWLSATRLRDYDLQADGMRLFFESKEFSAEQFLKPDNGTNIHSAIFAINAQHQYTSTKQVAATSPDAIKQRMAGMAKAKTYAETALEGKIKNKLDYFRCKYIVAFSLACDRDYKSAVPIYKEILSSNVPELHRESLSDLKEIESLLISGK
jgi:hypothetical protein